MSSLALMFVVAAVVSIMVLMWFATRSYIYKWGVINSLGKIAFGHIRIVDAKTNMVLCDITPNGAFRATIYIQGDVDVFFMRLAQDGEVGLGEMYMEGVWTTNDLLSLHMILVGNKDRFPDKGRFDPVSASVGEDSKDIQHHYDVGNDFYASFLLDDFMAYSCAFWFNPKDDLNSAQHNKINTVIRKLSAQPNMKILDVGCGWGRLAKYVAEQTDSHVTGVTISQEQAAFINGQGRSNNVAAMLCHYMEISNKLGRNVFDRVYSIGMLEHVRCSNYDAFFQSVHAVMKPGGVFVLHSITTDTDESTCEEGSRQYFVTKHIFPGGQIPKNEWVMSAAKRNGFTLLHLETYNGMHYAKTLRAWKANMFASAQKLLQSGYKKDILRKYEYYFTVCEALFTHNELQLSHFVLQKKSMFIE